ncbi:MAG TPA: hypothetical protein VFF68_09265, partial [Anaerolineaceae bacterium]|nr:hypothetical protein [Anaerolineaceae bacterium]
MTPRRTEEQPGVQRAESIGRSAKAEHPTDLWRGRPFGFWFSPPGAVILFVLLVITAILVWLLARQLALLVLAIAIAAALGP